VIEVSSFQGTQQSRYLRSSLEDTNRSSFRALSYLVSRLPVILSVIHHRQIPLQTIRYFTLALQPPWALASTFQFHDHFTDGRTPWTSDHLVTRPLPKHRTTQTLNKRIYTPNIHALSGFRTHDPSVRASEDSSCLRPRGYCDRHC
jgi:hypothetical protein